MREKEVWVVDFGESVDVGMFGVGGPPLKKKMRKDGRQLRERWIAHAVELLRAHKGHMGIIIYLRGEGLSAEIAKQTSTTSLMKRKGALRRSNVGLWCLLGSSSQWDWGCPWCRR